jgi:eukaryotic-like serine/threonine-protein kinase
MSPEQRLGRAATLASDVYGVGALLSELLAGQAAGPVVDRLDPAPSACHPDLTEAHDALVARLLQDDPRRRPADAFEARRLLLSLPWPERAWARPRRLSERPRSERPAAPAEQRLGATLEVGDGRDVARRQHDTWLDRDVLVLACDDATLARARAFARAGHPALPTVLRADRTADTLWVDLPGGRALADEPRGLSPGQVARLREAIEALHAAGGAHGRIDAEHLYLHDGEVTLAYPRASAEGDLAALDLAALAALAGVA